MFLNGWMTDRYENGAKPPVGRMTIGAEPMSMSAEEALDVAMKECETAEWGELWAGYVIERLASLGYALHPIAIDEGAVEKAAKAAEDCRRDLIERPLARIWREIARAAISTYLEAVRTKP